MPWLYQQLFSHGNVKPCCKFTRFITHHDAPMSVYKQSLDEIWNSDDMRSIRRAMVRGETVSGCAECYQEEESGVKPGRSEIKIGKPRGSIKTRLVSKCSKQGLSRTTTGLSLRPLGYSWMLATYVT